MEIHVAAQIPGVRAEKTPILDEMVYAGEANAHVSLDPILHHHLVSCLADHLSDGDVMSRTLALDWLEARTERHGAVTLKNLGDEALLLSGLFPERAKHLGVSRGYFATMGQGAYTGLAERFADWKLAEDARRYRHAAEMFSCLSAVLAGSRLSPAYIAFRSRFLDRLSGLAPS